MKTLFYFILITCLFSCLNNPNKINTTTENTLEKHSTSNFEKTTLLSTTDRPQITSSDKPKITFSEMPLLATYINELPFYAHEFPLEKTANRLVLRADTIHFLEGEEDGDYSYYYQLDTFNQEQAQFTGGWYGTAGEEDWEATYQILSDNKEAPIVLLAVQSKETFGGYQETLESNYTDLEEMIEAGNTSIDVDDLYDIAQDMTNMGRNITSLSGYYHIHHLRFWVWQKQKGQWKNITSQVFQTEMYSNLVASFPFLAENKMKNPPYPGFFLEEQMYSKEGLAQNQANWKHWLGIEELEEVLFDLNINAKAIQLEVSKNKTIRWDWNGDFFTLKNLPSPIPWKDEPCSVLDYASHKKYTFEGEIGNSPVRMDVSLNDNEIIGNYWYTENPSSKFPIKGYFEASTETTLNFYRMKKGAKREWFHAYFADCQLEGWWQHQGTMKMEDFSLKLVQE
jgi:hypothetical protein